MTHDEKVEIDNALISGVKMMLQKAQEVTRIKSTWTISEMEIMSDMLKNVSGVYLDYVKANERSIEYSPESF